MSLTQRLRTLVRVAVHDLFGEDPLPEPSPKPDAGDARRLDDLLTEAQTRLDTLRLELAEAVEREKRLTRQGAEVAAQGKTLDEAVDAALRAGQEDRAAETLKKLQRTQAYGQELEALRQTSAQFTAQLRAEVETRQDQLAQLRIRAQALSAREQAAETLESLVKAQRDLAREAEALTKEFHAREEQITRREDYLAARQEWDQ